MVMGSLVRVGMIALVVLCLVSRECPAAQDGRVSSDNGGVHEQPVAGSAVVYRFGKGDAVRMSDRHKNGWYRVAIPVKSGERPLFGWMRAEDVDPDTADRDLKKAGIIMIEPVIRESLPRKRFSFYIHYNLSFIKPSSLQKHPGGKGESFPLPTFGGGMGYVFNSRFTLFAQYEYFKFDKMLLVHNETNTYDAKGNIVALVLEVRALDYRPWLLNVSIGGGAAFNTEMNAGIHYTDVQVARTVTGVLPYAAKDFYIPYGTADVSFQWYFYEPFSAKIRGGYRYLNRNTVTMLAPGQSAPVDAEFSGYFFGVVMQVDF
ncbi:MAG: hypothetical protein A2583_09420 [Bdellovibrionales bacterium RIFOXYD1_FULL_53_11]|nr:MAG: hypothetical protein A2583_09420 [Bdellovibrionales bacterium RIFOXYD1_FULL_53_11]